MGNSAKVVHRILPKNVQDEIINELKAIKPREIWLFGSFSKGNPKPNSDLDLFVIKKKIGSKFHKELVDLRNELNKFQAKYGIEIDLFVDSKTAVRAKLASGDDFYKSIFQSGIKIYDKNFIKNISAKDKNQDKSKLGIWLRDNLFKMF